MAISRLDMERQLRNMGGIMSLEEPRQGYFLGKLVKKAKKAVKKVVKSPFGKAALLAAPFLMGGGAGSIGSFFGKGSFNPFMAKGKFSGLGSLLNKAGLVSGTGGLTGLGKIAGIGAASGLAGLLAGQEEDDETDYYRGEGLDIPDIIRRARMNDPEFRFLPGADYTSSYAEGGEVGGRKMMVDRLEVEVMPDESEERAMLDAMMNDIDEVMPEDRKMEFYRLLIPQLRRSGEMSDSEYEGLMGELFGEGKADGGIMKAKRGLVDEPGSYAGKKLKDVDKMSRRTLVKNLNSLELPETNASEFDDDNIRQILIDFAPDIFKGSWGSNSYAKGGEVAEGGIMNLGGNEMDLRGGGFVPLGAKEKADDVPARLSKNEFVMTADAVRAAGGGSVDKGADKMYKMMKQLEAQV
jgi:hypothetical protein